LQAGVNYRHPIISFEIDVSADAPAGDYSIRLQSTTGEVAYVSGGLTVEPASGASDPDTRAAIASALAISNNLLDIFLQG